MNDPLEKQGFVQHPDVTQTSEFVKLSLASAMVEGFVEIFGENQVWSDDFKRALTDALSAAYQAPTPETRAKLRKLEERLSAPVAAANKPVEERTTQEQKVVDAERSAADIDGDGVVSVEEARNRVSAIFEELGLDEQAQWFRNRQKVRSRTA